MDRHRGEKMIDSGSAADRIATCGLMPIVRFERLDQAMKIVEAL
jgi:hypothetical protein